jgi:hypothetical protein
MDQANFIGDYCIRIRDYHSPDSWFYTNGNEIDASESYNQLPKVTINGTTAVVTFDKFK